MRKLVKVNEVIANFLVANRSKDHKLLSDKHYEFKLSILFFFYSHLPLALLKTLIKDKERLKRFLTHDWRIEEIWLKDVGSWPGMGDLPVEWCQLSVLDTANMVKQNTNMNFESIGRINKITEVIEVVSKKLFPILVPGGEIRNENGLLYLPFDSDDGSHRLIALALIGKKKVLAYVGLID